MGIPKYGVKLSDIQSDASSSDAGSSSSTAKLTTANGTSAKTAILNDKPIKTSDIRDIEEAVMGVSISAKEPVSVTFNRYKPLIDEVHKVRVMGAVALMLCEVANGSFDFHMDIREKLRIVDLAAGIIIVREAGGQVISRNGLPLEVSLSIGSHSSIIAINSKLGDYIKAKLPKLNHYD